jgi:hypothetical protein
LDQTRSMITKLDDIPEQLTQCMLNRFQINGAHPLLESRVQEMISNANNTLRDVLLAEIRLARGATNIIEQGALETPESQAWPAGTLIDGHMQWTWGGRIHMVPQGWCLPKGNVSMLFNLWVVGNPAMRIQPYRFLKGWDLQATEAKAGAKVPMVLSKAARRKALATTTRTWESYLSQATDVMIVIEEHCGMTFQRLAALSAQDREAKYIEAFQTMCRRLHPGLSDEQLDAKRLYENSYTTVYSALSKQKMLRKCLGKRKQREEVDSCSEGSERRIHLQHKRKRRVAAESDRECSEG